MSIPKKNVVSEDARKRTSSGTILAAPHEPRTAARAHSSTRLVATRPEQSVGPSTPLPRKPAAATLLEHGKSVPYHVQRPVDAEVRVVLTPQRSSELDADAHHKRAQLLLKRGDYAGALGEAHHALRKEGCARHEALYAWLLYLRGGGASGRAHDSALRHLESALKRDPECEQAHYYKAVVLKHLGRSERARAHFRRTLKLNPHNLEAARELRLLDARSKPRSASDFIQQLLSPRGNTKPDLR